MNSYKILIVDDDIDNLQIIYALITEYLPEYEVLQTNNPENVLSIAPKAKPDLIITDWDMPKISGIELIKLLKADYKTKDIPVIMITGIMITAKNLKIALESGAVDYIRKPIEPVELIARINSVLKLQDYYIQIMEQKDKELTESALHLIRSHEFINGFNNKLHEIQSIIKSNPDSAIKILTKLGQDILQKNNEDNWIRFKLAFSKVHKDFNKNLIRQCPKLTPSEINLCSFIKLGMSNKEIASVLYQSPDSVKVSRYRIRKKLKLERNENFETYLSKF